MRHIFIPLIFSFIAIATHGQNMTDSIEVIHSQGVTFLQNGIKLTPRDLFDVTFLNTEAREEMRMARTNHAFASVFSFVGGFLIGWPVGTELGGGEPNWSLVGVGAGLITTSIPFASAYAKHAKKAVASFNKNPRRIGYHDAEFRLGLASNGIGLRILF